MLKCRKQKKYNQYDSRLIRFHTLKYVRMIQKNIRIILMLELWLLLRKQVRKESAVGGVDSG
jgi:hypothetical protein